MAFPDFHKLILPMLTLVTDSTIIIIDGQKLYENRIDFNVGVSLVLTYELTRINADCSIKVLD